MSIRSWLHLLDNNHTCNIFLYGSCATTLSEVVISIVTFYEHLIMIRDIDFHPRCHDWDTADYIEVYCCFTQRN